MVHVPAETSSLRHSNNTAAARKVGRELEAARGPIPVTGNDGTGPGASGRGSGGVGANGVGCSGLQLAREQAERADRRPRCEYR